MSAIRPTLPLSTIIVLYNLSTCFSFSRERPMQDRFIVPRFGLSNNGGVHPVYLFFFSPSSLFVVMPETGPGVGEPERGQREEGHGGQQEVVRLQQRFHVGKAKIVKVVSRSTYGMRVRWGQHLSAAWARVHSLQFVSYAAE